MSHLLSLTGTCYVQDSHLINCRLHSSHRNRKKSALVSSGILATPLQPLRRRGQNGRRPGPSWGCSSGFSLSRDFYHPTSSITHLTTHAHHDTTTKISVLVRGRRGPALSGQRLEHDKRREHDKRALKRYRGPDDVLSRPGGGSSRPAAARRPVRRRHAEPCSAFLQDGRSRCLWRGLPSTT